MPHPNLNLAHFEKEAARLTPWTNNHNIWFKRDDFFSPLCAGGPNGSKLRALLHLFRSRGNATRVITAASGLSPQHLLTAAVSAAAGLPHTHITASKNPLTYPSLHIAQLLGGDFQHVKVGYQPALNRALQLALAATPGSWPVPYGIAEHDEARFAAFYGVNAAQVHNIPPDVETLYVPAGSCHTLLGVLTGLAQHPHKVRKLVSVGIGPDKTDTVRHRLQVMGIDPAALPFEWDHSISLHTSGYASYGDRMRDDLCGVPGHPTYEGKIFRWLKANNTLSHNGKEGFWIVGSEADPFSVDAALQNYF